MEDPKNLKSLDDGRFVQKDKDVEKHRKEEEEKRKLQGNGHEQDKRRPVDVENVKSE